MSDTKWLDKQNGPVQSFEKVPHTYIAEDTGEMHCAKCRSTETCMPNRSRSFLTYIHQAEIFERFTERHLHEVTLP